MSLSEARDPMTMDPLAETVDPDALNELFGGLSRCGAVSFVYSHSRVTVEHNEYVEVSPVD